MQSEELPLDRRLRQEILFARERVYRFDQPTPLEPLILADGKPGPEIWVKREDRSRIKSYKWRGAGNRMALLTEDERRKGVVTASAGNHAQGVALAASKLEIDAVIYMPRSTPRVKQNAVKELGGARVRILLTGDSYDDAVTKAQLHSRDSGAVYIHAYNDLHVMAGQGTLADEVVLSGHGPFDAAYLQIGGGGMAAASADWLKTYWPKIEMVGVEGTDQASMTAALAAGKPIRLENVDIFCDGTAVREAGELPFQICRQLLDRTVTVTNSEVTSAIRLLWESLRCISEPSGALGLAAVMKDRERLVGKRVLVVVSGSNIDFLQLGTIAQSEGAESNATRSLRIRLPERTDAMVTLLDTCFSGINVSDFQYGKHHASEAWPVFTVGAEDPSVLDALPARLDAAGYQWDDLTGAVDVAFRVIPLRSDLMRFPVFYRLDFYERPGALHGFLNRHVRGRADICYFNYRQSGERIGRALIGFDFPEEASREEFTKALPEHGEGYRSCKVVDAATQRRIST